MRRADEHAASRIAGALNVLLLRLTELPAGKLWVRCTTGYRAAIAASLLQRAVREVALIDAKFSDAEAAGIRVEKAAAASG
ncbi:MAG: hypothetical protein ABWX85_09700 [Arthrobacter sp.]